MDIADDMLTSIPKRGKGGRNPAMDARLDPAIDPRKAARVMANRLVRGEENHSTRLVFRVSVCRRLALTGCSM